MNLQHTCPECGEHENIDVDITVALWSSGEPPHSVWPVRLVFDFTCFNCDHEWQMETDDFDTEENQNP